MRKRFPLRARRERVSRDCDRRAARTRPLTKVCEFRLAWYHGMSIVRGIKAGRCRDRPKNVTHDEYRNVFVVSAGACGNGCKARISVTDRRYRALVSEGNLRRHSAGEVSAKKQRIGDPLQTFTSLRRNSLAMQNNVSPSARANDLAYIKCNIYVIQFSLSLSCKNITI